MPNISWEQYGISGVVIGALFFIVWRILCWVMKWVDKTNDQHNAERCMWLKTLDALNASIQMHNQGSIEARKQSEEAHSYQREEHKGMLETLGRINGYRHD